LIKHGKCVYVESHLSITVPEIEEALDNSL